MAVCRGLFTGSDRREACGAVERATRKLEDVDKKALKQIVLAPASEYGLETEF